MNFTPLFTRFTRALTFALLPLVCLYTGPQAYASATKPEERIVTVSADTVRIGTLISEIEKQTGCLVVYSSQEVETSRQVRLKSRSMTAAKLIKEVFAPMGIDGVFDNNYIILKAVRKQNTPPAGDRKAPSDDGRTAVRGTVSDAAGAGIAGATVLEKGSSNGTISGADGSFRISVPSDAVLEVSFLGYQKSEIPVNGRTELQVRLQESERLIDEVVVVGYGTQDKKTLTGSVSVVKMADVETSSKSTVSQSLAGRAAGLRVNQVSAQAGGGVKFRIRGELSDMSNSPLVVIDGLPVTEGSTLGSGNIYESGSTDNLLGSLNPDDIESITVLKDAASTAIYGSRAGHGVILITTKRGAKERPVVTYSGNISVQTVAKHYEMLSADQYMDMYNRQSYEEYLRTYALGMYSRFMTAPSGTIPEYVPAYTDDQIKHLKGTDWTDEVSRTGILHQHNVSVRGGTESFRYMASANYMKQQGIIRGNTAQRITVRSNLDWDISKWVSAGFTATYSQNKYDNIPLGEGEHENAGILRAAAMANPTIPIRDVNGDYSIDPARPTSPNPVSLLEITDISVFDRIMGSAFVTAKPVEGLELKFQLGADRQFQKRSSYLPKTVLEGMRRNGDANIRQREDDSYLMDLTATYTKTFGKHRLKVLAGYSYEKRDYEYVSARNTDFMIDGSLYYQLWAGQADKPEVGSDGGRKTLSSYFGRINYDYEQRYLLEVSMRADGDSNFHPDYRWGIFPSVAVGWVVSEERFMQSARKWLSNLKIRASFGETGNSNVPYQVYDSFSIQYPAAVIGDKIVAGITDSTVGNSKLTWETTREFNLGIDIGFKNNRYSVAFEYYRRTIRDLITWNSLMYYYPVSSVIANGGVTRGTGFELTLNTTNIDRKDFTWNTTFTASRYVDRWKERPPYWKPAPYQKVDDQKTAWWSYKSLGLMPADADAPPVHQSTLLPGMVILLDKNNDKTLDDRDMVYMGASAPDLFIGLNNSLRWKNLDFSIYFYGEFGMTRGASYMENWTQMQSGYNVTRYAYESFTNSNRSGTRPSYISGGNGWGDFYTQDVYYIRCGNINLGYTIPVDKKFLRNIRVYADVSNPFVITNWKGLDPETDNLSFSYPNVRTYTVGLNITF
mgnify:FL=1